MVAGFIVIVAITIAVVALLRSDFGKDITTKTDAQLYRRYNAWLHHHKITFASDPVAALKASNELSRMNEEFQRRGYDINRLFNEDANAKWENRPMDFSKGRSQ